MTLSGLTLPQALLTWIPLAWEGATDFTGVRAQQLMHVMSVTLLRCLDASSVRTSTQIVLQHTCATGGSLCSKTGPGGSKPKMAANLGQHSTAQHSKNTPWHAGPQLHKRFTQRGAALHAAALQHAAAAIAIPLCPQVQQQEPDCC
jgi:hypothetical protein